ncbi:polysaccharide biosynthesis C-terminal domain-containing protein [Vibrio rhodolitus]|uniref:oligosaccharide flippase family protein n=1 Tax=Vibrio rhodolitus TaxID=2231649 RepID=UPI000E0C4126|nr:polysaccharide biosynthesis C-terminal domain-containing protein [Vibrio rhodolitus]
MEKLNFQFIKAISFQVASVGLSVVSGVFFAKLLGVQQYGLYGYALSIVSVATLPVVAGLPTLLVRQIANYQFEKKWGLLKGIINWSYGYVILVSSISITFVSLSIYFDWFDDDVIPLLIIGCIIIPSRGFLIIQSGGLNGFRYPILSQMLEKALIPLLSIVFSGIYYVSYGYLSAYILIVSYCGSALLSSVIGFFLLKLKHKRNSSISSAIYMFKDWSINLIPFGIMSLIANINMELAPILLGALDDYSSVAYFKVALQAVSLISVSLYAVNSVIMPNIARSFTEGNISKTQFYITQSVRISSIVSVPVLILLIFFGNTIIDMVFGEEYIRAYPLIIILSAGQIVNVLMGSAAVVLNMTGHENSALRSLAVSLVVNVIAMFLLIPNYGAMGAAISVSIGLTVWNVLMAISVYRLTGLYSFIR